MSAEEIFGEYRGWDRARSASAPAARRRFTIDRSPARRLQIGYVSPDFRQHAVALFAEALLAAHDRTAIELFCYAEVSSPDAVTGRFKALADHWRSTVGMNDVDMAELIRRDRIDVLVDLAGHTGGNRLLMFARKPAPVQVTCLLGHGYSSGCRPWIIPGRWRAGPPGRRCTVQRTRGRLSRIPLAYAPPPEMPTCTCCPRSTSGFVTFGYFGRTVRLNDAVIAAWARILHAVPRSRLMLNSAPFNEPPGASRWRPGSPHTASEARLALVFTSPQQRTGGHTARSTSRWTRFRTTPELRRSRRCGRAFRWCRSPVGRPSGGSGRHSSRDRVGRLGNR